MRLGASMSETEQGQYTVYSYSAPARSWGDTLRAYDEPGISPERRAWMRAYVAYQSHWEYWMVAREIYGRNTIVDRFLLWWNTRLYKRYKREQRKLGIAEGDEEDA
jgi:hypothetical protein